ncbi:hypothetical protein [Metallosphaera hakonensis]|uniref:hypothetical protein n=1 Tax=Metallosphaera hakonensis TaxID=79601 RepID=UPI000A5B42DE|nr:hypothetical protein [Metallosphaera hakonensis]
MERVLGVNGGIARYEGDSYLRDGNSPNPWFITTLWVAQELIAEGNKERALEYIKWVEKKFPQDRSDPRADYPIIYIPFSISPGLEPRRTHKDLSLP